MIRITAPVLGVALCFAACTPGFDTSLPQSAADIGDVSDVGDRDVVEEVGEDAVDDVETGSDADVRDVASETSDDVSPPDANGDAPDSTEGIGELDVVVSYPYVIDRPLVLSVVSQTTGGVHRERIDSPRFPERIEIAALPPGAYEIRAFVDLDESGDLSVSRDVSSTVDVVRVLADESQVTQIEISPAGPPIEIWIAYAGEIAIGSLRVLLSDRITTFDDYAYAYDFGTIEESSMYRVVVPAVPRGEWFVSAFVDTNDNRSWEPAGEAGYAARDPLEVFETTIEAGLTLENGCDPWGVPDSCSGTTVCHPVPGTPTVGTCRYQQGDALEGERCQVSDDCAPPLVCILAAGPNACRSPCIVSALSGAPGDTCSAFQECMAVIDTDGSLPLGGCE